MEEYAEKNVSRYATALDCAMLMYMSISQIEVVEIFEWKDKGTTPGDGLADKGEQWLLSAYRQLKRADDFADAWLQMDAETFFRQKITGLDDLSLATYASIVQERDHELNTTDSSQLGLENMCAAYQLLMDNPHGTFLLDYSWLYSDILEYNMVSDDNAYWKTHDQALAFALRYGSADNIRQQLISRVHDEITEGNLDRGVRWLALLVENWPAEFSVYESGAAALFTAGQKCLGNEVLYRARHLEMTGETKHFYEDLCFMYNLKPQKMHPKSQLEKRMARALAQPLPKSGRFTASELLESIFPDIHTVPVKQLCQKLGNRSQALTSHNIVAAFAQ